MKLAVTVRRPARAPSVDPMGTPPYCLDRSRKTAALTFLVECDFCLVRKCHVEGIYTRPASWARPSAHGMASAGRRAWCGCGRGWAPSNAQLQLATACSSTVARRPGLWNQLVLVISSGIGRHGYRSASSFVRTSNLLLQHAWRPQAAS